MDLAIDFLIMVLTTIVVIVAFGLPIAILFVMISSQIKDEQFEKVYLMSAARDSVILEENIKWLKQQGHCGNVDYYDQVCLILDEERNHYIHSKYLHNLPWHQFTLDILRWTTIKTISDDYKKNLAHKESNG